MKEVYSGKGKRGTSQCDRVNATSEAVFVGEQIPFYATAPPKEGVEEKYEDVPGGMLKEQSTADNKRERKLKKNKVLFYPRKFFLSQWTKAPAWVYKKKTERDTDKFNPKAIEDAIEEKRKAVIEKIKERKKTDRTEIDVPQSWYEVNYRGRIFLKSGFAVPAKKAEWYGDWKKNNPGKHPGPQQYWKRHPVKYQAGKLKPLEPKPVEQEEGKDKVYILDNKISGKKYYKPMKSHIF